MNKQVSELKTLSGKLRDAANKIDAACVALTDLESIGVILQQNGVTLPPVNGSVRPGRQPQGHPEPVSAPKPSGGKPTIHETAYSVLVEEEKAMLLDDLAATVGKRMGREVQSDSLRSVLSRTKDATDKRVYSPAGGGKWGLTRWNPDHQELL